MPFEKLKNESLSLVQGKLKWTRPPKLINIPPALTDLCFKLNQRCSQTTSPHGDSKSQSADPLWKQMRGHHTPTRKRTWNASPTATETKDNSAFTLLKLLIDQILRVIKHQPWVRLYKPSKCDTGSLRSRRILFFLWHSGHTTLHCWALKKHLEDLVQRGYVDKFVLDQEEDPEVGDIPGEVID